jgi:hypothetical protein
MIRQIGAAFIRAYSFGIRILALADEGDEVLCAYLPGRQSPRQELEENKETHEDASNYHRRPARQGSGPSR